MGSILKVTWKNIDRTTKNKDGNSLKVKVGFNIGQLTCWNKELL